jgi:hypothetical protein
MNRIAFFISPHGFGHAARACAVMEALRRIRPEIGFEIFTTVPEWFFSESLSLNFAYHRVTTDIGLVQKDAFHEDLEATRRSLDLFIPFQPRHVSTLAGQLLAAGCEGVVCDISPLGIAAARLAGIPSVLVENFTWDWIYSGYPAHRALLQPHIDYLSALYARADLHVRTEPACDVREADLSVGPISRRVRTGRKDLRQKLGIPAEGEMVLVTGGGFPKAYPFLDRLRGRPEIFFVLAGIGTARVEEENLLLLPPASGVFHPDLVHAADAVVGKAGYSTIAEVYRAAVPFGFVSREGFPESPKLVEFIEREILGFEITEPAFSRGDWIEGIDRLFGMPRKDRAFPDGADALAKWLSARLLSGGGAQKPDRSKGGFYGR